MLSCFVYIASDSRPLFPPPAVSGVSPLRRYHLRTLRHSNAGYSAPLPHYPPDSLLKSTWSYLHTGTLHPLISFASHSYENCRVCTQNSHSGTHLPVAYPPFFSITSTMPILQLLSFHIHAWNGGNGGAPNVPTFKRSLGLSPFASTTYRHTSTTAARQPLCNQSVTHSFYFDGGCTPLSASLLRHLFASLLHCLLLQGSQPPARFLDFPPVSSGGAELYIEAVPVQGEAMNEFTTWMQSNWYALANLLSQFVFLAAGIWFARKILRTMRASQEQVGALLKLSVAGATSERHSSSAVAERSFASASPYWLTPAEVTSAGQPKPPESGPSRWAVAEHSLMVWLQTPMSNGEAAPWRRAIRWLQSPAGS